MFQFRRFPPHGYEFTMRRPDMTPAGLLHSDTCGSKPAYGSPQLFAVCCVLLRLLVPRHSPCALCSLTMCFFWFSCSEIAVFPKQALFHACFRITLFPLICFVLYSVFKVHAASAAAHIPVRPGGLKWTRTTDLTLIRRAL